MAYSEHELPGLTTVPIAVLGRRILLLVGRESSKYAALLGQVVAFHAEHTQGANWSVSCVGKPYAYRLRVPFGEQVTSILALEPQLLRGHSLGVLSDTATADVAEAMALSG